MMVKLGFKQQRSISVLLLHIKDACTIERILVVPRSREDKGHVCAMFVIERVSIFCKCLITTRVDVDAIGILQRHSVMRHLPAFARFAQHFHTGHEGIAFPLIVPAVHEVVLFRLGHVGKSIIVVIVHLQRLVIVRQQGRSPTLTDVECGIGIAFQTGIAVAIQVEEEQIRLVLLRFLILHVDLSRHGFITILHRGDTLGNLNAFHPSAGNISQAIGRSHAAEVGNVLRQHLHIAARKSQQLDLLGTGGRIAVTHIHRGIALKTLAQVAARIAIETGTGDGFAIFQAAESAQSVRSASHHLGLTQIGFEFVQHKVQAVARNLKRVGRKSHKGGHHLGATCRVFHFEMSVSISRGGMTARQAAYHGSRQIHAMCITHRSQHLCLQHGDTKQGKEN